jgi:hypothetical protein
MEPSGSTLLYSRTYPYCFNPYCFNPFIQKSGVSRFHKKKVSIENKIVEGVIKDGT